VAAAPPHVYFVFSAVFHYLGPSFAVLLFARVEPLGVAWLRIVAAAAVLWAWRRSSLRIDRTVVAWGVVLALMNACFYLAIARLPLGTVAAIEFLPVIVLAALGARTPRNVLALAAAVTGAALIADVRLEAEPLGVALAAANAALFAIYIVLGHRAAVADVANCPARDGEVATGGLDRLAAAMLVAAVAITPLGLIDAAPALVDPVALAAGIGVGIASSVIPYVADQLALARLPRATYALMVALLPATATAIGLVVLGQVPTTRELAAVGLVVAGVALHRQVREAVA
jgi:inner membrane transporter RhtA